VKVGDVIYDHWINMKGIIIETYVQPPSMQLREECLMLLTFYEDNSISYAEAGDAEVIIESW